MIGEAQLVDEESMCGWGEEQVLAMGEHGGEEEHILATYGEIILSKEHILATRKTRLGKKITNYSSL
jgi:hypothetical protein